MSALCAPALRRVRACSSCKGAGRRAGTNRGFAARVPCGCRNGFIDVAPLHQLCVVQATPEQMETLPQGQIFCGMVVAPGFEWPANAPVAPVMLRTTEERDALARELGYVDAAHAHAGASR